MENVERACFVEDCKDFKIFVHSVGRDFGRGKDAKNAEVRKSVRMGGLHWGCGAPSLCACGVVKILLVVAGTRV
jgi:hypothetical protein